MIAANGDNHRIPGNRRSRDLTADGLRHNDFSGVDNVIARHGINDHPRQERFNIHRMGGDAAVARAAAVLGITEFHAGVTPQDKEAQIAALADVGAKVLMVGDGLNDTAALARAHVSISPATALDAARVASDIVLMGQDLAPVAGAIDLAGQARRRIKENFAISIAYNLVAVPFAIMGLATPLMAALAMSISSISVTLYALRLR